jgi:nitric oxide reductase activation protein
MSISVWTNKNPLDAEWVGPNPSDKYEQIKDIKRLNPVELEAMVLKHEQQIKNIEAKMRELKQLVTPMMEVKRREWVGLTEDETLYSNTNYLGKSAEAWHGGMAWAEAKLKEKNT